MTPDAMDLGNEAYDRGDYRAAAELFRTVAGDERGEALFNAGNSLAALGDHAGAIDAFSQAVGLKVHGAAFNLGKALEREGRLDEAADAFLIADREGDPKAPLALAFMAYDRSATDARAWLAKAIECTDEELALLAADVGLVWQWEDTKDPALEGDLREAASRYVDADVALGELLVTRGDAEPGLSRWRSAARDGSANARIKLGNYYWERGSYRKAARQFEKGVELGDDHCAENLALLRDEQRRRYRGSQ